MSTTIGENIKYFMYKYNVTMSDWYNLFSYIDKKIDVYVNRTVDMNVKYTAHAIQDLCEMRDLHNFELFDNAEIEQFMQYLCINSLNPGGDLSRHHLTFHRAERRLKSTSGLLALTSIYSTVITSYDIEKPRWYIV